MRTTTPTTLWLCLGLATLALVAGCEGAASPTASWVGALPPAANESPAPPTAHPLPAAPSAPPGVGIATPEGSACPPGYPIKGRGGAQGERWYYLPHSTGYDEVVPEVCFASIDKAHEAGHGPPPE